jgi:hypothetical protein
MLSPLVSNVGMYKPAALQPNSPMESRKCWEELIRAFRKTQGLHCFQCFIEPGGIRAHKNEQQKVTLIDPHDVRPTQDCSGQFVRLL